MENPFDLSRETRLYRTGDVGRYRNDGTIEFIGRKDTQVKIRGFRIELGEIEEALSKKQRVKSAVASVVEFTPTDPCLVAYVVPVDGSTLDGGELREYLRPLLPDYMIPAHFVFLDELPLTANGKVNRKALPLPDQAAARTNELVLPQDETETKLVRLWESVLNIHPIGVRDDFFTLGGHSILAVRLFTEIEKCFAKRIPLATLLKAPTVAELANVIRGKTKTYKWTSLVAVQVSGTLAPLFCVHGHYGEVLFYRPLARYLGNERPFYALQAVATNGRPAHETIEDMAAHYVSEMRQAQSRGPYYIAGYCFGSLIAFEMAQRLILQGDEVAFLGLFMGYEPHDPFFARLRTRIRRHLEQLREAGLIAKLADIRFNLHAKFKAMIWRMMYKAGRNVLAPTARVFQNIPQMNLQAARAYLPRFYPGKMTVFLSGDVRPGFVLDPKIDLHGLNAEKIELKIVPGDQHTMMHDPHVRMLAVQLDGCLRADPRKGNNQSPGIATS
jgi:thioesterase domain-containing protein/acyl carrier protein